MAGRTPSQKSSLENVSTQSAKSHGNNDKLKSVGNKACKSFDGNSSSVYKTKSSTRSNYNNSWRHKNKNNQGVSSNFNLSGCGNYKGRKKQFMQSCREETDMPVGEKFQQKKVNLNHLLNFSYDPIDCDPKAVQPSKTNKYHRLNQNQNKIYNKEKFLQANCQFVVKEDGCYDIHRHDPDVLVNWDNVEQIHMWNEKTTNCPICLDPPYAAKITRCGHVYCWPCMLHYLALDNKPWRKCPICHEAVHKKDLKSVKVLPEKVHSVSDTVTMKLMHRYRGSVIPVPLELSETKAEYKFGGLEPEPRFWKVLTADKNTILNRVIEREMDELLTKKAIEEDELEIMFIESAITECKDRQKLLLETIDDETTTEENSVSESTLTLDAMNDTLASNISHTASIATSEEPTSSNQPHSYYFYQATDDQNLFLHPLNIRCLTKEYGSLENCPSTISATILEIQNYSMDELTRKRHRYLSHLPLSCEFGIAELKLKPPVVSQGVLNEFSQAIDERAVQRKKKSREEKRILRRMQVDEMKKHGVYPAARISLESYRQFPAIEPARANSGSSFSVLVPQPATHDEQPASDSSNIASPLSCSVGSHESYSTDNSNNGFSFAHMVRNSATQPQPRWVKAKSNVGTTAQAGTMAQDEPYDPDYVPLPTYQSTFSQALSDALDNLENAPKPIQGGGRRRQKKGKKKVILFSTASQVPHN